MRSGRRPPEGVEVAGTIAPDDLVLGAEILHREGQQGPTDSFGALVFDLAIGTSPQSLSVVKDITSELVWVQCGPCPSCIRFTPPTTPTFLPRASSSYVQVGCQTDTCDYMLPHLGEHYCVQNDNLCGYTKPYNDAGSTSGFLATETFSFGTTPAQAVVFGCSGNITVPNLDGASGFAGFSKGPLSLVSQLKMSSFTYFIAPPGDPAGRNSLSWSWEAGEYAALQMPTTKWGSSSSTRLLPRTAENQNPYLYYVNLTGVQLDSELLTAIPAGTFDVQADGSGGVYLSTTLPVTYLAEAAYRVLRPELASKIQSQGVFPVNAVAGDNPDSLCFLTEDLAKAKIPTIALLFDGADAAMELKPENYFFADDSGRSCLTIQPSYYGSILGSLLQASRKMTYDVNGPGDGWLTFETAAAGARLPARVSLMILVTLLVSVLSQSFLTSSQISGA